MRDWGLNEWLSEKQLRVKVTERFEREGVDPGNQQKHKRTTAEKVSEEDLGNPELVREKYLARLMAKKNQSQFDNVTRTMASSAMMPEKPTGNAFATTASIGIMPHNDNTKKDLSVAYDPNQFPWTVRNNGTPHVIKYMQSRHLRWGVCLDSDMEPKKIHGFDDDMLRLIAARPAEASVVELREMLADTTDRMALERQRIMVVSDCEKMLTAAKRQDMLVCAYEAKGAFKQYFEHRIDTMYNLQHEIEKLNGVSHIAALNGSSVLGDQGSGHTYGFG